MIGVHFSGIAIPRLRIEIVVATTTIGGARVSVGEEAIEIEERGIPIPRALLEIEENFLSIPIAPREVVAPVPLPFDRVRPDRRDFITRRASLLSYIARRAASPRGGGSGTSAGGSGISSRLASELGPTTSITGT